MPIIIALYWYLAKKNKEAPLEKNGLKTLSVHKFFFYFGIIIPLLGFVLLIAPLALINDPEFLTIIMMIVRNWITFYWYWTFLFCGI